LISLALDVITGNMVHYGRVFVSVEVALVDVLVRFCEALEIVAHHLFFILCFFTVQSCLRRTRARNTATAPTTASTAPALRPVSSAPVRGSGLESDPLSDGLSPPALAAVSVTVNELVISPLESLTTTS